MTYDTLIKNFFVAPVHPHARMLHHSSPNHVQINVDKAQHKMIICIYSRGMIPIFPEGALALLAAVVFLYGSSSDQLH